MQRLLKQYRNDVRDALAEADVHLLELEVAGDRADPELLGRLSRLVHETPLKVLSGDDNQNFVALCLGAHGTIAASAHVLPGVHVRILESLRAGQTEAARRLSVALQPIIRCLFEEPNPAPLKALLAAQDYCQATVRLPFVPASQDLCERLRSEWNVLNSLDLQAA